MRARSLVWNTRAGLAAHGGSDGDVVDHGEGRKDGCAFELVWLQYLPAPTVAPVWAAPRLYAVWSCATRRGVDGAAGRSIVFIVPKKSVKLEIVP